VEAVRTSTVILLALALGAGAASAHPAVDGTDDIMAPAPTYKAGGVQVKERLGAKIPIDARFRTPDGKLVSLNDVLAGDLPTILTFNYSNCPMLCSLQLNGLSTVIPKLLDGKPALRLGIQYRIVTIDLEPKEPLDTLAKMKDRYVQRLPEAQRDAARTGWTFLAAATPGDGAAIRRVAESVGFEYTYIPERAEWAHPAALIFLSTAGAVTRYVYGIEFDPAVMRESIMKAGQAEPATAVGFLNRCYHYDPGANSHAHAGVVALRVGAASFVVLLAGAFGFVQYRKKHRRGNS
jgi:protein SCO1/2